MKNKRPLIGFYGDDFTGSSENLAQFHRSGLKARLFLKIPSNEVLAEAASELDMIGFAGTARALDRERIGLEVDPAFKALREAGCSFLQYKICSTFDSAPEVGNFGFVAEKLKNEFDELDVAVLAATPDFGRYTVFGNHFAKFGSDILRLDRHPSMSNHPRTPMREADLKAHLKTLCSLPFSNIFLPEIRINSSVRSRIEEVFSKGEGIVFDGVENSDLDNVVRALWDRKTGKPTLAIAAQGFAQALGQYLASQANPTELRPVKTEIPAVSNLLVLSGSCAIQTGRQIDAAVASGWATIELDPTVLKTDRQASLTLERLKPIVLDSLAKGQPTIVYTALGNKMDRNSFEDVAPEGIGKVYAQLMTAARVETKLPRVVLAGGDSSSYSVRFSDAESLTIKVFDEAQHSHLCELSGQASGLDGLELLLKGGQVGDEDYLLRVLHGSGG